MCCRFIRSILVLVSWLAHLAPPEDQREIEDISWTLTGDTTSRGDSLLITKPYVWGSFKDGVLLVQVLIQFKNGSYIATSTYGEELLKSPPILSPSLTGTLTDSSSWEQTKLSELSLKNATCIPP